MRDCLKFYIDGAWVEPATAETEEVINPATEEVAGRISLGASADVDRAVKAARRAFASYSQTSRKERLSLLGRIQSGLEARLDDLASAITEEMGAPTWLAKGEQAALGIAHVQAARTILEAFPFEERRGQTLLLREPIGVCGMITPWNWPLNQIACKVAPALAVGCTMVLKPSEIAPFSAQIWAEILHEAGVPPGVFNLVNGHGPTVGAAISTHPDIDMVSFTGSTRAGIEVARSAAPTVKRVCQELGGKSPNIILEDADLQAAIRAGVKEVMLNTGQTCSALTRILAPRARMAEVIEIARQTAQAVAVGPPESDAGMGPLASRAQWEKVQRLIQRGVDDGAVLVTGGLGRPEGLDVGYYVKPTVFADVTPAMAIAQEEVFGPVVAILGYDTVDQAVEMANDTPYGLSSGVSGRDPAQVRAVTRRLRAGQVYVNGADLDIHAPFGGYKQSGNGREWGPHGFADYLEVKAVMGMPA